MGVWIGILLAILVCGCGDESNTGTEKPFITLSTTTSARNSGLLDDLLPRFTAKTGIEVRVVAVGTGRAIQLARDGDADGVLVHHEGLEKQFVADGYGIERLPVMYNEFIVVGPKADPSELGTAKDASHAFQLLAQGKGPFVSRGDQSGTHLRELATWKMSGVDPAPVSGEWYREAGRGMGGTLNMAVAMGAYCLTDSGTWLSFKNRRKLVVHVQGDPKLFNAYTFMVVSPEKQPHVKNELAQKFADWMVGPEGQKAIAAFRIGGEQAFYPNAKQ